MELSETKYVSMGGIQIVNYWILIYFSMHS